MSDKKADAQKTVVKAVALVKEFRDFWHRPKAKAVNEIDFEVNEGEVFGLLGPNGSGKSTTLKILLGLLYPTRGSVSIFGKSPRDVKTKAAIGYLPEESYLYRYLTAFETLDFFGSVFGLPHAERKKRAEQLLDMVGLAHARNRRLGEFSKGMSRRIGLAQAMINDPELLILDEPTSGLDPIGCREIKDLIKFLKSRGKTVVISSHLLADVQDRCDRVIILYGGKIRGSGTLDELLTVSEMSRIVTPLLEPGLRDRIVGEISQSMGGIPVSVDHPRRTLEEYFLEVVRKAREEKTGTYGAEGGGEIAEYLKKDGNMLIEALSSKLPPPGEDTDAKDKSESLEKEMADKKIREITDSKRLGEDAPAPSPESEDLSAANSRISQLLNEDKR